MKRSRVLGGALKGLQLAVAWEQIHVIWSKMKGFLRFFKKNRNQFLLGNSPSPVDFGVLKHIDALVCRPSNLVVLLNYVLTYYISKHKDSTYRASISSSIDRLRQTSLFGFWGENLTESNFRLNKSPVEIIILVWYGRLGSGCKI